MTDERTIFAEIEAVLADRGETRLDRLEHTLTSGYAAALALEEVEDFSPLGELIGYVDESQQEEHEANRRTDLEPLATHRAFDANGGVL